MSCYCGSENTYVTCCQPFHLNEKKPTTAEQLMRSRYSAYATKNATYIYDTYAKQSQVDQSVNGIKSWADECKWLKLTVNDHQSNLMDKSHQATVDFSAYYLTGCKYYLLSELSRFVLENGQWKYLDGDIKAHHLISTIKRNAPCPCGSSKKFKHCCHKQ